MTRAQKTSPSDVIPSILLVLSLGVLLGGVGCAAVQQSPQTLPMPPEPVPPSAALTGLNNSLAAMALPAPAAAADYRLGPEDLLEITLFNVPPTEVGVTPRVTEKRVSEQGLITLALLGDIPVAGLTPSTLEQTLAERYATYLRNPEVGVVVKEYRSQRVSIIGAVRSPGVFQLTGPISLIDLLAMAGGINENAGRQVHLYRQGPDDRELRVLDLYALLRNPSSAPAEMAELTIQPGDIINVPEAGMFFVDGAVKKPGSFPLNRPYTLTQALGVAGGVDFELAKTSDVSIIRRKGTTDIATVSVNLNTIRAGKAIDPNIEAEDVIVVPVSGIKYLAKRFVGGMISGFSLHSLLLR